MTYLGERGFVSDDVLVRRAEHVELAAAHLRLQRLSRRRRTLVGDLDDGRRPALHLHHPVRHRPVKQAHCVTSTRTTMERNNDEMWSVDSQGILTRVGR